MLAASGAQVGAAASQHLRFQWNRKAAEWPVKCLVNGMGRNGLSRIRMPGLVVVLSIAAVARAAITERPYEPATDGVEGMCQPNYTSVSRGCDLRIPSLSIRN